MGKETKLTIEQRSEIRIKAGLLMDQKCGTCTTILEKRKELGNKKAYTYCIKECPIGKEIQELGKKLLEN